MEKSQEVIQSGSNLPRIKVQVGFTLNVENFENVRYEFGVEDDVPEGKKVSEHMAEWTERLEKVTAGKVKEYERKHWLEGN